MKTYRIFIGANNITENVEIDKIQSVLNLHFQGYTIENSIGYWLGIKEKSVIVTISGDSSEIIKAIKELKTVLKQDAIGYQVTTALNFI